MTPPHGACCAGTTCSVVLATACTGPNTRYAGDNTACNLPGVDTQPCCHADFDQNGAVTVTDIFAFLNAWFAGDPHADINGGGITTQDIFDFLNAWFAGC
jgi:hypothetical protein